MGSSSASGATGTGGGGAVALAYTLTEYVAADKKLWEGLRHASATDSTGRLFVTDAKTVYAITDGVPSIYLTYADITASMGGLNTEVLSLDTGPDDRLYILVDTFPTRILVSSAQHDVSVHTTWNDQPFFATPSLLGVVNTDQVLMATALGLYAFTPGATTQLYAAGDFPGANGGCLDLDFAVTQDNYFYYLPCGTYGLLGGATDGSGVDVVTKQADLNEDYAWFFSGVARHPKGGAAMNLVGTAYYFDKSGAATELSMNPSMDTIKEPGDGFSIFMSRPVEVGPYGDIYLIGATRIYRATPL